MPRFRIDSPASPVRKFVLPADERATPPAPLPELYTHVTPHVWGAGAAKQTPRRVLKAQAPTSRRPVEPKRTSRRPVEAQMGSGGLYTARAPIAPRKGRRVLEFTAASEYQMSGFMGTIQLRINPDSVDLSRLAQGIMSLAIDHDTSKLMGRITEATIHPGRLDMKAEISSTATATEAMAEVDDLTRAGFSPGFLIHETETLSEGDPGYDESEMFQIVVTRFEIYEVSSTAIPRSPDARLKGVASMGNVIAMDDGSMDAPEILHREDLVGLSLAAARQVLASGKGSERQRSKLKAFFKLFDAGVSAGLSRDLAATAAKAETGL